MQPTHETWLPVVGYEGLYEVSDLGRVRSLDRYVSNGHRMRIAKGRVLSVYEGDKYSKVRLKRGDGGSTKNVHTLVMAAFVGPRPEGLEVCHGNGNAHDNRLFNLRYDTHSANGLDKVRHGHDHLASRTHCNAGHEFTPENTIDRRSQCAKESGRRCRTCESARAKAKYLRKKERLALLAA